MSSKPRLFGMLAAFFAGALTMTAATPRAMYRIALRDGSSVLSMDRPRPVGSVMVFHRYPGGTLTSVPAEMMVEVRTGLRPSAPQGPGAAAPLQPGEVVVLGLTAPGGAAPASTDTAAVAAPRQGIPGGVYDPRNPAYGYSGGGGPNALPNQLVNPLNPSGVTTVPVAGDLARAVSGEPPNLEQPIGANGFPTTPGTAATPQIGPDGTPILAPANMPGSTSPAIGPNGTPVLAPRGAPGSTPPQIGPNGTPVLAPPGAPGSAQPAIGPNGTPAAPAPGSGGAAPKSK